MGAMQPPDPLEIRDEVRLALDRFAVVHRRVTEAGGTVWHRDIVVHRWQRF